MTRVSRAALALSGGGFTGYLFEIGALTALDDLFEEGFCVNDFDLHLGVSAGAAAAALMANGVRPEEVLRANLAGERPYYFERRDIFAPAMGEGLKTLLRAVQQLIPIVRLYARHHRDMSFIDLLEKAQETLPSGLYTLAPFARYLESTFHVKGLSNAFSGLKKELYIPAIDLESGQSVVFGDAGWQEVAISRAITASSAAPIYFCPVRIGDRDYIDAGIGRIAFFDLALAKHTDFMVIIHPHVLGDGRSLGLPERIRDRGFFWIGDQASRINLEARFSLASELYQRVHPERFLVISPVPTERLLFERSFLSFRGRVHLLCCGYLSVVQAVRAEYAQMKARFGRHGIAISLGQLEERMGRRLEQLSAAADAPLQTFAGGRLRAHPTA